MGSPAACQPIMPSDTLLAFQPAPASAWAACADRPLYVICRSGNRSGHAAQALAGAGWDTSNVSDGMIGWQAAGLPMTCESGQPYVA